MRSNDHSKVELELHRHGEPCTNRLLTACDDDLLPTYEVACSDPPNAQAPLEVVIVQVGDKQLQGVSYPHGWGGHILHYAVKQGLQSGCQGIRVLARRAILAAGIHDGEVQLLVSGAQLHEQVKGGVDDIIGPAGQTRG